MSSRTISWQQLVSDADPDYWRDALQPVIYEFSNGATFRRAADPYGGGAGQEQTVDSFDTLIDPFGVVLTDPLTGAVIGP